MQVVPFVIRMIHRFYHAGGQAAQRPAGAGLVDAKPGRQFGDAQRLLADFNHQMDLQRRKREPLLCLFNMPNSLTKLRANALKSLMFTTLCSLFFHLHARLDGLLVDSVT